MRGEKLTKTGVSKPFRAEPLVLVSGKAFEEVRQENRGAESKDFTKKIRSLPGIAREDLRASLGKTRAGGNISRRAGRIGGRRKSSTCKASLVKQAGSQIALLPEEAKAKEQIEAAFASAGLAVPSVKEVLAKLSVEAKRAEKLLQILLREKNLVRVSPELIFHRRCAGSTEGAAFRLQESQGRPDLRAGFQGTDGDYPQICHPPAGIPGPRAGDAPGGGRACYTLDSCR